MANARLEWSGVGAVTLGQRMYAHLCFISVMLAEKVAFEETSVLPPIRCWTLKASVPALFA